MVELLMVAFLFAVGLLGLLGLMLASLRVKGSDRMRNTANGIAQTVLEASDAEARARRATRTLGAERPPDTPTYFGGSDIYAYYDIRGLPISQDSPQVIFRSTSSCRKESNGNEAGGLYTVTVVVRFTESIGSGKTPNAVERTVTLRRRLAL